MLAIPKLAIQGLAGTAFLLGATLAATPALATGTVVNHLRLPQGTTMATCLQRAAVAIASSGLSPLNTTQSAAWGQREGGRIYTIYCIPANDVAIFVGAGNTSGEVSSDVTAMMNAFRSGGTGGGAGGGGGGGTGGGGSRK